MSRYKIHLVNEAEKQMKEQEEQEQLREKYKIEDQDVFVVEKSHLIPDILKLFLSILVYMLAVTGLLCLIYPATRDALFMILDGLMDQLESFLPFLGQVIREVTS